DEGQSRFAKRIHLGKGCREVRKAPLDSRAEEPASDSVSAGSDTAKIYIQGWCHRVVLYLSAENAEIDEKTFDIIDNLRFAARNVQRLCGSESHIVNLNRERIRNARLDLRCERIVCKHVAVMEIPN